jgi:LacI family transcriptional regulator
MSEDNRPFASLPAKRATIKDVARAAKVSPMTVSNVLNNKNGLVSSKTKMRVEREVSRLNYRRQSSAQNLRGATQDSIGMIVIDPSPYFLADLFTTQIAAGLANVLNSFDYSMTVQGMKLSELGSSMIMRNIQVGGFCAMISGTAEERHEALSKLQSLGQPLIVFQEEVPSELDDVCSVRQADWSGGQMIADHLLARGVENIVVLRPLQGWSAIENRIQGLTESVKLLNPNIKLNTVQAQSESFRDVQATFSGFLANNPLPDAIFCCNDQMAMAAVLLLNERGYSIPDDVRIIGFNGFEAHRYLRPQLTTVFSPAYELGQQAGESMLARLSAGAFPVRDIVLPVHFGAGSTT